MAAGTATSVEPEAIHHCRLCGGQTELRYPGQAGWADTGDLAPSSHQVGVHGDLYVCVRCGTVQPDELPTPEFMASRYADTEDEHYLDEERGRRRTAHRLLDLLGERVPPGRLLDIGCGHGLLMAEARDRGWDPTGLELSRSATAHARKIGLRVLEERIEDAALEPASFQAVVAVDLIEHVHEPRDFIARCRELLVPARAFGRRWWGYIPSHLHLLPRRMLRELLAAEGFALADDVAMVRDFSLRYWVSGLADRGGPMGRLKGLVDRLPDPDRLIGVALGDERVMVATRVQRRQAAAPLAARTESSPNIHAVLPAYRALATVAAVAEELPGDAINRALLVDDASPDATAEVALEHGFDVIVHPANRGYGANQKTCYVNALRDGADVVVMVHADNQYDPRLLPQMVAPIIDGEADVVIGSRLLNDRAIIGGMPRWKWVGNKFLTWTENMAFRRQYSEYHTGYRAFSAEFLRSVAFLRNSDAFVFDQEIFAQAVASGARVTEIAIPTRYFLDASSVSFRQSVRYGLKTLVVLARFRASETGLMRWPLLDPPAFGLEPHEPVAGGS
jgi:SAM-dependent methyltransferase